MSYSNKVDDVESLRTFYEDCPVVVTGAHGFKGAWLCLLLKELGADVVGIGLPTDDVLNTFEVLGLEDTISDLRLYDIRDPGIKEEINSHRPSVVFHLAAQPLVSEGYADPVTTFESNIMGTVNVMEAVRDAECRTSLVCITTDKVYQDNENYRSYVEDDPLKGRDPYSASKSCAEIVAYSYFKSFFEATHDDENAKILSTCRAGNVIGGGDFSLNRIVPDIVAALSSGEPLSIKNPLSVRPYQHVLDALYAYVLLGATQFQYPVLANAYNIGPNSSSIMKTEELVQYVQDRMVLDVVQAPRTPFHESNFLTLDCEQFRSDFGWEPTWSSKEDILDQTFEWYTYWLDHPDEDMHNFTRRQIKEFLND